MTSSAEFVSIQRSGQVQCYAAHLDGAHPVTLLAGYRRHTEFDAGDNLGQDWCGARASGTACAMVVADGVSQSFMGDIAARVLGVGLLDGIAREGEAALTEPRCHAMLDTLRAVADREVADYALTDAIPGFLRSALESRRTTSGTQAVIAAAWIDLSTHRGRVLLVGDVSVVVHRHGGPPVNLAGDRRARWSNLHGLRGAVVNEVLEDVCAIVLATDGVPQEFVQALTANTDEARAHEAMVTGAQRDDASFVALFSDVPTPTTSDGSPVVRAIPATVEGAPPQAPFLPSSAPSRGQARVAPAYAAQGAYANAPSPTPAPPTAPATPATSATSGRGWKVVLGVAFVLAGLGIAAAEVALSDDPKPEVTQTMRVALKAGPRVDAGRPTRSPSATSTGRPTGRAPVARSATLDAAVDGRDGAVDAAREVSVDADAARPSSGERTAGARRHHHHQGSSDTKAGGE